MEYIPHRELIDVLERGEKALKKIAEVGMRKMHFNLCSPYPILQCSKESQRKRFRMLR